ncbi:DUF2937 family protein [Thalassotalea aquiviva]|uniref:DUF2937 family protein n=1 Tax=Thalassotalea aquiviva TaxID=3242415 RepID=UPI00352BD0DB
MLRFLTHTFDRLLFVVNFIVAVQLPSFIVQYKQRLGGHLDEVSYQLSQFQHIADNQHNGDLQQLLKRYQGSIDPSINQTAELLAQLLARVDALSKQLNALNNSDYLSQIYHFFSQFDADIVLATASHYRLTIPLELNALLTGLIVSTAFSLLLFSGQAYFKAKAYNNPNMQKN